MNQPWATASAATPHGSKQRKERKKATAEGTSLYGSRTIRQGMAVFWDLGCHGDDQETGVSEEYGVPTSRVKGELNVKKPARSSQ
jgi:hypothetical protein